MSRMFNFRGYGEVVDQAIMKRYGFIRVPDNLAIFILFMYANGQN